MVYAQLTQPNCASERDTVEKWGVRAATAFAALSAGWAAAVTIKKRDGLRLSSSSSVKSKLQLEKCCAAHFKTLRYDAVYIGQTEEQRNKTLEKCSVCMMATLVSTNRMSVQQLSSRNQPCHCVLLLLLAVATQ